MSSLSSKNFQRKLENLESELLASKSVEGVHDWAANELRALSSLIRNNSTGTENIPPQTDLTMMSSFLSHSPSPPASIFVESELVSDSSSSSPPTPPPVTFDHNFVAPISSLYSSPFPPIDFQISRNEIEHARCGFVEFFKTRELEWESMRDSVLADKAKTKVLSVSKPSATTTSSVCVPKISIDNSAIIRTAISTTCLPGEIFKYQRDEIFDTMSHNPTTTSSRYIILFSSTNQFSGLYVVEEDDGGCSSATRIFSIIDPLNPCPHKIVPGIVLRRFRYTFSSGFVEMGSRYSQNGFWQNIDAVNLKTSI